MKTTADETILAIIMECAITRQFETYGTLPMCRRCREHCKNYNAKGLTRFVCEKSPEWAEENRRLNAS